MPPILMTRQERATLARLAARPSSINEVPPEHREKLVTHGLVVRDALRFRITTKGQLELFRQRFRDMALRRRAPLSESELVERLGRLNGRRPGGRSRLLAVKDGED